MVSDFWLGMSNGVSLWGTTGSATLLVFGLFIAIGITAAVGVKFKNKHLTIGTFFMMLGLEVLVGLIDWIYMLIPLIVTTALIFYLTRGGGQGAGN